MDLKTGSIFTVTTIHDRSGKRVGTYLVDRAKDSLNRDQKNNHSQKDSVSQEQAVVFHHADQEAQTPTSEHPELPNKKDPAALDLTV